MRSESIHIPIIGRTETIYMTMTMTTLLLNINTGYR